MDSILVGAAPALARLARRLTTAIVFKNHPEGARLVASFIRLEWLERPGATMSLSEAYEKWEGRRLCPQA
jgi:hypothetical protein